MVYGSRIRGCRRPDHSAAGAPTRLVFLGRRLDSRRVVRAAPGLSELPPGPRRRCTHCSRLPSLRRKSTHGSERAEFARTNTEVPGLSSAAGGALSAGEFRVARSSSPAAGGLSAGEFRVACSSTDATSSGGFGARAWAHATSIATSTTATTNPLAERRPLSVLDRVGMSAILRSGGRNTGGMPSPASHPSASPSGLQRDVDATGRKVEP